MLCLDDWTLHLTMGQLLPIELVGYFALFEHHFSKPNFVYFQAYLWGLLIARGRKTMSNIAHCCFFVERSLSSWERFLSKHLWDINAVCATLVKMLLTELGKELKVHGAFLVGVDTILIAKNGNKMPGVQKWADHSGNADRGDRIRGHHWAILGLISFHQAWRRHLCWPITMRLISGQLNPSQIIVDPNGKARLASIWDSILPLLITLQSQLSPAHLRVVADAYFSKVPFLEPLYKKGIHTITRMRKDAVGWDQRLEQEEGKAPKMEGKWKLAKLLQHFSAQSLQVTLYGKLAEVKAVTRDVFIRGFEHKVRVVTIQGRKRPIILLSTDITLTADQIIELYGARFSIELAIRELKQSFGLADYQCYVSIAIDRFVHLACVACSLFRLVQLHHTDSPWMPAVSKEMAELSLTRIRRGLQQFAIGRIWSRKFPAAENLEVHDPELEQILCLTM